ncbi:putative aminopeptidase P, cytoplasmic [Cylindrobasidium torrendii FP15055 ss-10]|uniref:Putative aminopeptidase P, cytoplasmic n=1 Tax=Cylindrobasidium torrendii FP15055 ss-10 TaxID=1314674 RepID=A0A0D7BTQ8_9AGAR|nr:putative aminopeptidase P, cytoplasmic [Cylindrobasidium torrendii FP15055 ss-10]
MTVQTGERLASLRKLMSEWKGEKRQSLDVYVVPSEDAHGSEYSAPCDDRRAWISGFDGSAGCAVITHDKALLFTDGRYWLQASGQLDDNWTLMKQGALNVPTWQDYLSKSIPSDSLIGIDPTLIAASDATTIKTALAPRSSTLVPVIQNLVDGAWDSDRPARPANKIFELSTEWSGKGHQEKLSEVQAELAKLEDGKVDAVVLSALDEIAWLFNLRGSDIDYNPVFFSYAIVPKEGEAQLFVQEAAEVEFASNKGLQGVNISAYDKFWDALKKVVADSEKVLVPNSSSLAISTVIGDKTYMAASPISILKAIKNQVELDGFRNSHVRDGVALVRYFAWLEEKLNSEDNQVNEWDAATVLEQYRSELQHFRGLSFPTISSTGKNGAIIHYGPSKDDSAVVDPNELYLCDSGAQFTDGTTDVTRTWHFGKNVPRAEEIRAFTRVLQGHIAIDTAVFPGGTTGFTIDSWARRALWKDGLDYRHGTGHGIGHFLNVHEGPHGIGLRIAYNATPLQPGMVVSNEPGYYEDGKFGVRIESVVLVKEIKDGMGKWGGEAGKGFGGKGWYEFERVTMCPIQKKLVDKSLLTKDEVEWLDGYHAEVLDKVGPLLGNDTRARAWLEKECSPI